MGWARARTPALFPLTTRCGSPAPSSNAPHFHARLHTCPVHTPRSYDRTIMQAVLDGQGVRLQPVALHRGRRGAGRPPAAALPGLAVARDAGVGLLRPLHRRAFARSPPLFLLLGAAQCPQRARFKQHQTLLSPPLPTNPRHTQQHPQTPQNPQTLNPPQQVFSFGVVLWELVTLRKPWVDDAPPDYRGNLDLYIRDAVTVRAGGGGLLF